MFVLRCSCAWRGGWLNGWCCRRWSRSLAATGAVCPGLSHPSWTSNAAAAQGLASSALYPEGSTGVATVLSFADFNADGVNDIYMQRATTTGAPLPALFLFNTPGSPGAFTASPWVTLAGRAAIADFNQGEPYWRVLLVALRPSLPTLTVTASNAVVARGAFWRERSRSRIPWLAVGVCCRPVCVLGVVAGCGDDCRW